MGQENEKLSLDELRIQIDDVDSKIVALFEERMIISKGIAKAKLGMGKPIFDESRENIKLESVASKLTDKDNTESIKNVFRVLMDESKKLQKKIVDEVGVSEDK